MDGTSCSPGSHKLHMVTWRNQMEPSQFAKRMRYTVMIWPVIRHRMGTWLNIIALISPSEVLWASAPLYPCTCNCFRFRQGMGTKGSCNISFTSLVVNAEAWSNCSVTKEDSTCSLMPLLRKAGHTFATGEHLQERSHATRRHQKQQSKSNAWRAKYADKDMVRFWEWIPKFILANY